MSFKKLALISVLIILLGAGVVYALNYIVQQRDSSVNIGRNGDLELTIRLERNVFSLGEPVNMTYTIANVGNKVVGFSWAPSWEDYLVYNDTDNVVFEWQNSGNVFPMFVQYVQLEPQTNLTHPLIWSQTYFNTTTYQGSPVSAGTYYIVAKYGIDWQTWPIVITIVGP